MNIRMDRWWLSKKTSVQMLPSFGEHQQLFHLIIISYAVNSEMLLCHAEDRCSKFSFSVQISSFEKTDLIYKKYISQDFFFPLSKVVQLSNNNNNNNNNKKKLIQSLYMN